MIRSRTALAAATVLLAASLTACDSSGTPVTYTPSAYGANGQCYYVDSPAEASALLAAGLCPAGWVAAPAPLGWEEKYFAYYSSPAYYNTYIPAGHRTTYVKVTVVNFNSAHSADISRLSKTASYKGSNGKTVTGPATAKMKFSSGSGSVKTGGGGSLRGAPTTAAHAPTAARPTARRTSAGSLGGH